MRNLRNFKKPTKTAGCSVLDSSGCFDSFVNSFEMMWIAVGLNQAFYVEKYTYTAEAN